MLLRGRERSPGREKYSRIPDAWCSRGEMPHVFLGERHVHMNSFELSSIHIFQPWFSVSYLLPISHVRFRGSKTPKGKKSVKFIAYLYSWGHVEFMWYLVLTLYMSSQSWYSCGFFCLLWLVDIPVLSNLVCAGSFHPKPTQDHKVSICITVMCMRISCWCTYCLQEGLMSMKVHF